MRKVSMRLILNVVMCKIRALMNTSSPTWTFSGGASLNGLTFCYSQFGGTYCETPTGEVNVPNDFCNCGRGCGWGWKDDAEEYQSFDDVIRLAKQSSDSAWRSGWTLDRLAKMERIY